MKKLFLFLSLACAVQLPGFGQNPTVPQPSPEQIRAEIVKRGLEPQAVEGAMRAKGFDIYNLAPEQVPAAQSAFSDVYKQLAAEKAAANPANAQPAAPAAGQPPAPAAGQPTDPAAPGTLPTTAPAPVAAPAGTLPGTAPADAATGQQPGTAPAPATPPANAADPKIDPAKTPGDAAGQIVDPTKPPEQKPAEPQPQPVGGAGAGGIAVAGGGPKPVYGVELFRNNKLTVYQKTNDINTPEDYVLGPGDNVVVSVWGTVANYTEALTVSADGYVLPKTLPRVYLKGTTFRKAKQQLKAVFSQRYPVNQGNFEVAVSQTRTVDVTVTGEVFNFGSFKISALNTAFQALAASGGPTDVGSVRNIVLYRSGQPKRTIDIYPFMLDPTVSNNFYLENGDNIFVPPAERVVEIQGGVLRPDRYELARGEQLRKLLDWAGGLRKETYLNNIQISRLIANQSRTVIDLNLKEILDNNRDFDLLDGDVISFRNVVAPLENFVSVSGAVEYPNNYAIVPGARVREVIEKAKLKRTARTNFATLVRTLIDGRSEYYKLNIDSLLRGDSAANLALQFKDQVIVYDNGQFTDGMLNLESSGAVRTPLTFPYDHRKTIRVSDLVQLSGGLQINAQDFAFIARSKPDRPGETTQIRIPLKAALENPGGPDDVLLEPGDRVFVPMRQRERDSYTVTSAGALRDPREVPIDNQKSLKISGLVELSNGLLPTAVDFAYLFRSYPDRPKERSTFRIPLREILSNPESPDNLPLEPGDRLFVPNKASYFESYSVSSSGSVRNPQEYPIDVDKTLRVSNLVELSNGLLPDAVDFAYIFRTYPDRPKEQTIIRINLKAALQNPGSEADLPLEPGDRLRVPNKSAYLEGYSVASRGAVRSPQEYPVDFSKTLRVSHLVELSSGLLPDAVEFAYIFRTFPDRPKEQSTLRINLKAALAAPGSEADTPLEPGDRLFVPNKAAYLESYTVASQGAVRNPQEYPIDVTKTLRISNLVELSSGLVPDAMDYAYIYRTYPDRPKETSTLRVNNLRAILANPGTEADRSLEPGDRLFIPNKSAFRDAYSAESQGAFRNPHSIALDYDKSLKVSNLIEISNGLLPDATDFGYIFRTFPDKPKEQTYIRVELREIMSNPGGPADIAIEPNDRLVALSKGLFQESFDVKVSGAVKNPGNYRWDASLRLRDVLTLAGGLKREAASNRIEIFRVTLNQNRPTQTSAGIFEVDRDFQVVNADNFVLMPLDIIVVRSVPEFEMQKMVNIQGEVRYPGEYALIGKNEKVSSLIERAGGLSREAFPDGATLKRAESGIGFIVLKLKKALRRPGSHYNLVLKAGDVVAIPKQQDLVSIGGNTKALEIYPDKIVANGGRITVGHRPGRRAGYYVRNDAAGFGDDAARNSVTVELPNGQIRRTKHFLFIRAYPKVPKGSHIYVSTKKPKPVDPDNPAAPAEVVKKQPVDWEKVFAETITKVTAIVTLLVLIDRL